MRTFARDSETNDIVFERFASKSGNRVLLDAAVDEGKTGIGDVIEAIVKTEKGELSLDVGSGIRHTQLLSYGESVLPFWKKDMTDSVSECEYVNEIKSFEVDYNREKHTIFYELTVGTNEGDVVVEDGSSTLAKVVRYATEPNLDFEDVYYPDSRYDSTVIKFDFTSLMPLTTDPQIVIRVRRMKNAPTVTVYWMDGTRDIVSADGDTILTHIYTKESLLAEVRIGHGAEWLAVGPSDGTIDISRKTISTIGKFATTVENLDYAFFGTRLRKSDYTKPSKVSDVSWNLAFSLPYLSAEDSIAALRECVNNLIIMIVNFTHETGTVSSIVPADESDVIPEIVRVFNEILTRSVNTDLDFSSLSQMLSTDVLSVLRTKYNAMRDIVYAAIYV